MSASELEHLDLEVWLLSNPQPVQARGQDRAQAITLGTHGVKVVRGQASELFLPSVPVENQWDTSTLLDRVCLKAGLPAPACGTAAASRPASWPGLAAAPAT